MSAETWIYGFNPVLEAIKAGRKMKVIYISQGRHEKVIVLKREAEKSRIAVEIAGKNFFHSLPKGHQGVAACVVPKEYIGLDELMDIPRRKGEPPLFVILDCIEDPRNLGAVLRSAEAAGVHGVVIQSFRSAGLGPAVMKASAGAVEFIPLTMVPNIKHAMESCRENGISVIGAEGGSGAAPWEFDLTVPLALVIGSEGRGLRRTVREQCDAVVSIPMKGSINSLNASVAAGILLFEVLRQRTPGVSGGKQ